MHCLTKETKEKASKMYQSVLIPSTMYNVCNVCSTISNYAKRTCTKNVSDYNICTVALNNVLDCAKILMANNQNCEKRTKSS